MDEQSHAPGKPRNLVEAYGSGLRPGTCDLSAPAPQVVPTPLSAGAPDLSYSAPGGTLALREAIARRYRTLDADDILVTSGASEALAATALACAALGIEVSTDRGTYPSFTELDSLVSRRAGRGRAGLLTNPTVPDGQRVDVAAALRAARLAGATLIVDEVYGHIALTTEPPAAAADLDPSAVSIDDLSKPLGLGGLRIGWIATRNRPLREEMRRWLALLAGGPSVLSELQAIAALAQFDATVAAHRASALQNADEVYRVLDEAGWRYERAQLGLTVAAYPPEPLVPGHDEVLARAGYFLLDASLLGLPGAYRISLLAPPDALREALALLTSRATATQAVVVLTRIPAPGYGKSRLAARIGTARAHALASAFVQDTLALSQSRSWRTVLAYAPGHQSVAARALAPDAALVPQAEGDLGARIRGALDAGLADAARVVLIGSDTPDLPRDVIEDAFAALDDHDAVLGRADDGGFYLIGVRASSPAMFDDVEWSTSSVYERTRASLERLGWRVADVAPWCDVDDEASLAALERRLDGSTRAPATRAVLDATLAGTPS